MLNLTRDISTFGDLTRDISTFGDLTRDISNFGLQDLRLPAKTCIATQCPIPTLMDLTRDISTFGDLTRDISTFGDLTRDISIFNDLARNRVTQVVNVNAPSAPAPSVNVNASPVINVSNPFPVSPAYPYPIAYPVYSGPSITNIDIELMNMFNKDGRKITHNADGSVTVREKNPLGPPLHKVNTPSKEDQLHQRFPTCFSYDPEICAAKTQEQCIALGSKAVWRNAGVCVDNFFGLL